MANTYFTRTNSTGGNRQVFTFSAWVKRGTLPGSTQYLFDAGTSTSTDSGRFSIYFNSANQFGCAGGATTYKESSANYRDLSAWYHLVVAVDSTQGTAGNRVKLYVNGSEVTNFQNNNSMSLNQNTPCNENAKNHDIGRNQPNNSNFFDGYMAHVHFTDGTQYAASDFGETDTNGQWKPKTTPSVTYGTNGFFLKFANSGSLGTDSSGNGNNFTKNGDGRQVPSTPDNVFAIINTNDLLNIGGANSAQTISKAGRQITGTTDEGRSMGSTIHITPNGISKAYCEWYGLSGNTGNPAQDLFYSNNVGGYIANDDVPANNIVMMAVDCVAGKYWFGNNGVWDGSGDPANGTNPTGTFTANSEVQWGHRCYNSGRTQVVNFGQDSSFAGNKTAQNNADSNGYGDFYYTPPSGFLSLCTKNLAEEGTLNIGNGKDYFNTKQYSGNSGSQSITGVGFQPDLLWIKTKSAHENHVLFNSTRGAGSQVRPNTTGAETNTAYIDSFDTDGWSMNTSLKDTNFNTYDYASWSWLLNGGSTSTNTNGTITSTVQANPTAGISLVTFTGDGNANATVGHGLNAVPEVIIIKNLTNTADPKGFAVNINLSTKYRMNLNANNGDFGDYNTYMGTQTSTNIVFGGTNNGAWNESGQTMMALCFHSVEGYCKIGTWIGNANADGAFVYTGFRPGLIIHKDTTSTEQWQMHDTGMNPYNLANNFLFPNLTNGTATSNGGYQDILSNGIKIRTSDGASNGSGRPYFYMAWAENPFVDSTGRPVTAR